MAPGRGDLLPADARPTDPNPFPVPDASLLNEFRYGVWRLPGGVERLADGCTSPFAHRSRNPDWQARLNGFAWLKEFRAGTEEERCAWLPDLLADWLAGSRSERAGGTAVLGERLLSWRSNADLVFGMPDADLGAALWQSYQMQLRRLRRVAPYLPEGPGRLIGLIALVHGEIATASDDRTLFRALSLLTRELDRCILPDGGHVSRSPETLLTVATHLAFLSDRLVDAESARNLNDVLARICSMLCFFRHQDGGLAVLNGGREGGRAALQLLLRRKGRKARAFDFAHHSRFQRLARGETTLLMDAGTAPADAFAGEAAAGALSFEMSVSGHRVIVNCGADNRRAGIWGDAGRQTAAHSTLTLADRSTASLARPGLARRIVGNSPVTTPRNVSTRRSEAEEGIWLEAEHDGYAAAFDLVHHRRLYMDQDGLDIRGEDRLMPPLRGRRGQKSARGELPYAIRFHVHPDVRLSLSSDRQKALMRLPNGQGWQFRALSENGAQLAVEQSVYLGEGHIRPCEQIVVHGETVAGQARVIWALQFAGTKRALRVSGSDDGASRETPLLQLVEA